MGAIPVDGIDRELEHHERRSVRMSVSQRARRRLERDLRVEERRQAVARSFAEKVVGDWVWRRPRQAGEWVGPWERFARCP